jgi:hypothetical protein
LVPRIVPRIAWVEDEDADGELAALYAKLREGLPGVPAILRTMSVRPDLLAAMTQAMSLHFTDGALSRAHHEMIASHVSALNRCHY